MYYRIVKDYHFLPENREGYFVEYSKKGRWWERIQMFALSAPVDYMFRTKKEAEEWIADEELKKKLKERGPVIVKEYEV